MCSPANVHPVFSIQTVKFCTRLREDLTLMFFYKRYFKDVSRECDEFEVNTHLCKLRCWHL